LRKPEANPAFSPPWKRNESESGSSDGVALSVFSSHVNI
jgi:hypothetical protein